MSTLKANIAVMPQDIFSTSSTQGTDLGALATTGDGRYFRYTLAGGTTLAPGTLVQAAAEDTTNQQGLAITNASVGATSVVTTATVTLAANLLAGGYMTMSQGTLGKGYTYRISGNTAASGAVVTFYLNDPILVATTGSTLIDVKKHPYDSVVVAPTTQTSCVVGAAIYPVTNAQYGWVQTHGICAALAQGTVVVGDSLKPAVTTTAGTLVSATNGVVSPVAYAINGIASTDYGLVFLTID